MWRRAKVAEGHLSDRTINKLLALLHGIFKRAQRLYGLAGNPVAAADRQPHKRHGDIDVLDSQDVLLLASHAANEQDAAICTVAAFTGMRLGELLALRWPRRRVRQATRARPLVLRAGPRGSPEEPQGPVSPAHGPRRPRPRRSVPPGAVHRPRRPRFVNVVGQHLDGDELRRRYVKALDRAGLRRLRFHDLRHTFGTLAVQVFPLTDVKAFMGHADIATTMVYVHHVPQHDAADRLTRLVYRASHNDVRNELRETERT